MWLIEPKEKLLQYIVKMQLSLAYSDLISLLMIKASLGAADFMRLADIICRTSLVKDYLIYGT